MIVDNDSILVSAEIEAVASTREERPIKHASTDVIAAASRSFRKTTTSKEEMTYDEPEPHAAKPFQAKGRCVFE